MILTKILILVHLPPVLCIILILLVDCHTKESLLLSLQKQQNLRLHCIMERALIGKPKIKISNSRFSPQMKFIPSLPHQQAPLRMILIHMNDYSLIHLINATIGRLTKQTALHQHRTSEIMLSTVIPVILKHIILMNLNAHFLAAKMAIIWTNETHASNAQLTNQSHVHFIKILYSLRLKKKATLIQSRFILHLKKSHL